MDQATALIISRIVTEGITGLIRAARASGLAQDQLEAATKAALDQADATWHRIAARSQPQE